MQKVIQRHVLDNWGDLFPGKARPNGLTTLQISQSHGKGYRLGRIVHLIFEAGGDFPILAARFCRDSSYEESLASEANILKELGNTAIASNVPVTLGSPMIGGRRVILEEAVRGKSMSVSARNAYYGLEKNAFKCRVSEHMSLAASFLVSLRQVQLSITGKDDGGTVLAEMTPAISRYTERYKLKGAEEYVLHGLIRAIDALLGENPPACLAHADYTPSNILLRGDAGFKVIDWEFARPSRLGIMDGMRFIYYYYEILNSLHEFGEDGFHETFIKGDNWFSSMAFDFAREVEGGAVKDWSDFRALMGCFLILEANMQVDCRGEIESSDMLHFRERVNSLIGFFSVKEREDLLNEKDGLLKEKAAFYREREKLEGEVAESRLQIEYLTKAIEGITSSKSWRLTYPVRRISAMLKRTKANS